MIRLVLLVAGVLLSGQALAQMYQCTGDAGETLFSQQPCGDDSQPMDLQYRSIEAPLAPSPRRAAPAVAPAPEPEPAGSQRGQAPRPDRTAPGVDSCPSDRAIERAVRAGNIMRCMTRAEVDRASGTTRVRWTDSQKITSQGINVTERFYTARRGDWPRVVWFRSGKVVAFGDL